MSKLDPRETVKRLSSVGINAEFVEIMVLSFTVVERRKWDEGFALLGEVSHP